MFGLRMVAVAMLLCIALWLGGASPAAARGGGIVIGGNALAALLAGGLQWQPGPRRYDPPRTFTSRSGSKARTANRGGAHKPNAKKTRTEVARKATKPSRGESGNQADDTAPATDTEQQRSVTSPSDAAGNTAPDPEPSAVAALTNADPAPALPAQPAPAMLPPALPAAPPETSTDLANAASSSISTPAEITSAQEHLKLMGYDVPQASGSLDLKTTIAIIQFQDSIGVPTTGLLTREQLGMLFQKSVAHLQAQQPQR